ncbi:MAG: hexose kinase [Humibacillus sp.]|nr:hexose kinase [Humibacillus sp.]MDN5778025.1 hexose kinase [Humibacillus sp.]
MILTLTPNPAIDITYRIAAVTLGESHRVEHVTERAGGKGINTAAVLTSMGVDALALAPVGDATQPFFAADLDGRGIRHHLVRAPRPTRRSVALVDDAHEATLFNEAGAPMPDAVWHEVIGQVERLGGAGGVLTVSGSLPAQSPTDLVARVTRAAHEAGVRVVLDVSGPALSNSLAFAPELVKPNRSEAIATLTALNRADPAASAAEPLTETSATGLARLLVEAGARAAVVSDGAAGLALAAGSVSLRAWLPKALQGNPTGAGDALTAALAASLDDLPPDRLPDDREAWAEVLRRGVAWSAAAVLQPVAGPIDPGDVARLLPTVEIEETLS